MKIESKQVKRNMKTIEKINVWAAIHSGVGSWDEQEQLYLGKIVWKDAAKWATQQKNRVRLSLSEGYNNQGYYIN